MERYWKRPEETAETLKDGWVHTGDMGYMDEDRYIFLVDRKKDVVISGGFNVYPKEVENVLYTHPAVAETAVIGVPDETWGEAVKAIVRLKPETTATEEELIELCKENIAHYKAPRSVDFVDDFPRTVTFKIHKPTLREKYWAGYETRIWGGGKKQPPHGEAG